MAGRKSELNTATKKRIYDLLCDGNSMVTVARKLGVSRGAIYKWMHKDDKLAALVKEARIIQASTLIDDCLGIADDESKDILEDPETGRKYPNAAAVARAKVKISTRKQLSGYYHPEKYAEGLKIDVTSNGESVSGFLGLIITPPKEEGEEDDV